MPEFDWRRARTTARTEAIAAANAGTLEGWRQSEVVEGKIWCCAGGSRSRDTHKEADNKRVGLEEPFIVGGYKLMHPGDSSLGAGPEEVCNCRCTMKSVLSSSATSYNLGSGKKGDTDGYSTIDKVVPINYNDKNAVNEELQSFRNSYSLSKKEHAVVISPNGNRYEITGTDISVNIELAGKDALKGSIVSHNHPLAHSNSFSKADIITFFEHELDELRVVCGSTEQKIRYSGKQLSAKQAHKLYETARDEVYEVA